MAALTTISDALYEADLTTAGGTVTATPSAVTWKGGDLKQLFQASVSATVATNGQFSISLEPNDTAVPINTSYRIQFVVAGVQWQETWIVPTSVSTVGLDTVRVLSVPPISLLIPVIQLAQNGATPGQALVWSGTVWGPGTIVGGGAAGITDTKYTISYTNAAFVANSASANVQLFMLPARSKIMAVTVKHSVAFLGAGTVQVEIGNGGTQLAAYAPLWNISQAVGDVFQDNADFLSTSMLIAPVTATFISSGLLGNGSVTNLTGGSVDINVVSKALT